MKVVKGFKNAETTLDLTGDEAVTAMLADLDKAYEDRQKANAVIEAIKVLDDFCRKLARPYGLRATSKSAECILKEWPSTKAEIEQKLAQRREQIERASSPSHYSVDWALDAVKKLESELVEKTAQSAAAGCFMRRPCFSEKITRRAFEVRGWDVTFWAEWTTEFARGSESFEIEIKPSLGDDFPAVLRQMKARSRGLSGSCGEQVLVIGGFTATGATFDQVKAVFAADNFRVVTFAGIEATSI